MKIENTSFQDAPDVILKALVELTHMGKVAVKSSQEMVEDLFIKELFQSKGCQIPSDSTLFSEWKQPNEVLVLAYMEKDHIGVSITI